MAQDTFTDILQDLKKKYKKQTLTVIETSRECGVSSTTFRQGLKLGAKNKQFIKNSHLTKIFLNGKGSK